MSLCDTCKHNNGYVDGSETHMELVKKSCCDGMDFPTDSEQMKSCVYYLKK